MISTSTKIYLFTFDKSDTNKGGVNCPIEILKYVQNWRWCSSNVGILTETASLFIATHLVCQGLHGILGVKYSVIYLGHNVTLKKQKQKQKYLKALFQKNFKETRCISAIDNYHTLNSPSLLWGTNTNNFFFPPK